VIYTGKPSWVALLMAGAGTRQAVVSDLVFTMQIAPTILKALDLDPAEPRIAHTASWGSD